MFAPTDFRRRSRKVEQRTLEVGVADSKDRGDAEEHESPPQSEPERPWEPPGWPIQWDWGWSETRFRETFSEDACDAMERAIGLMVAELEEIY